MTWLDKWVTRIAYLLSSKAEKERHLEELRQALKENQARAEIIERRLNDMLSTPLRVREVQEDYMKSAFVDSVRFLRDSLKATLKMADRLKERIEIIRPSFPRARAKRKS